MSLALTVKLLGTADIIKRLAKKLETVDQKLFDAKKECGFMVENTAKHLSKVVTGRQRASITTNWIGSGMSRAEVKEPVKESKATDGVHEPKDKIFSVVVGTNVEYAKDNEAGIGTRKPFLYPAVAQNEARINARLAAVVKESIEND